VCTLRSGTGSDGRRGRRVTGVQAGTTLERLPVRRLLGRRDFRRLLATRLLSQFGDGVFQAALAGTVLFNPERAADPLDVAAGFAVLLLPYSLVGPFAGVWLDRWSRRQVLLVANIVRAALVALVAVLVAGGVGGLPFYLAGLAVFSVNRFVLAALSAALPHTTDEPDLVSANALSTTSGAVVTVVGGGAALLLLDAIGAGDASYALVAVASAVPYLLASAVAGRFRRPALGPHARAGSARLRAWDVVAGMAAGARHVWARPRAAAALGAISLHRFCYGLLTLMTLLLYRNTFSPHTGWFRGGLVGLGEVIGAGAIGTLLAAVLTPSAVRRMALRRWVVLLLAGGGVAQLALGLPFAAPSVVAAALVLGFVAQAVKICVDTTVQEEVADDFRGRVFSVYDTLFNVLFVAALLVAAVLLPASGISVAMLLAVAVLYLLAALVMEWIRDA
jgi:MFS family permease